MPTAGCRYLCQQDRWGSLLVVSRVPALPLGSHAPHGRLLLVPLHRQSPLQQDRFFVGHTNLEEQKRILLRASWVSHGTPEDLGAQLTARQTGWHPKSPQPCDSALAHRGGVRQHPAGTAAPLALESPPCHQGLLQSPMSVGLQLLMQSPGGSSGLAEPRTQAQVHPPWGWKARGHPGWRQKSYWEGALPPSTLSPQVSAPQTWERGCNGGFCVSTGLKTEAWALRYRLNIILVCLWGLPDEVSL